MDVVNTVWTLVAVLLLPFALLLVLPLLSDACSVATRWLAGGSTDVPKRVEVPRARILVLVPAHNEELLVADSVRSMVAMRRCHCDFDVVVIADNSTDRTAALAAAAGARVLERFDPAHRGKPWALQWAMERLPLRQYDAIAFIDADTIVDPGFADELAVRGPLRDKAVQSYNAIANTRESWLTVLGALLVSMRYDGQFALKRSVGLNCPISNGWCVGTDLIVASGWPTDSLTETWEMYARFTALGARVDYAPEAVTFTQEAHTLAHSATQRRRWQAGKREVFRKYWATIARSRRVGARQKLDAIGELAAPGPVLHATFATPLSLVLALAPARAAHFVALLFAASLVPVLAWSTRTCYRQPRRARLLVAFAHIPAYALWRVVIAIQSIATARRAAWQRSPRHSSA